MRFITDECVGPKLSEWLRGQGHDVFSIFEQARGSTEEAILQKALAEDRIIITADKDFGELAFREKLPHRGIILLRLNNDLAASKIAALQQLLEGYADQIKGRFCVVKETATRIVGVVPDKE